MAQTTTVGVSRRPTDQVLQALGLAALIVGVEYLARHVVLFWFPALGAWLVNDMLVTGLCYVGLVWLTLAPGQRDRGRIGRTLREIVAGARTWQVWAAAVIAALGAILLSLVDQVLWGAIQLPSLISPWRWETTLLEGAAPLLVPVALLLVNGGVIPVAEEWLWRGLIQPRLIGALGSVAGVLLTAVLFSLKHVIVDASLGRLLALTGFGLMLGLLAARQGWRASALAHALANSALSLLTLLSSGVAP